MKYLNRNGAGGNEHDPLSERIIGIAIEVHKELGPGFMESIYHRALELELADAGIPFVSEAPLTVIYKGHVLGNFSADFLIEKSLLVELKALETLPVISEVQVVHYLKAAGLPVGLILNFGTTPLQIKRKYRDRAPADFNLRLHEV